MTARAVAVIMLLLCATAVARDAGQWGATDAQVRAWFRNLMQPDNPTVSCYGEADAYYSDSYEVSEKGEYIAIITDERDDVPLGRIPRAPGTKVLVPNSKISLTVVTRPAGASYSSSGLGKSCVLFLAEGFKS